MRTKLWINDRENMKNFTPIFAILITTTLGFTSCSKSSSPTPADSKVAHPAKYTLASYSQKYPVTQKTSLADSDYRDFGTEINSCLKREFVSVGRDWKDPQSPAILVELILSGQMVANYAVVEDYYRLKKPQCIDVELPQNSNCFAQKNDLEKILRFCGNFISDQEAAKALAEISQTAISDDQQRLKSLLSEAQNFVSQTFLDQLLIAAVRSGKSVSADVLLDAGASIGEPDSSGVSAIEYAWVMSDKHIINTFLKASRSNLDKALASIMDKCNAEVVGALLDAGAVSGKFTAKCLSQSLELAAKSGNEEKGASIVERMKIFLKAGADPNGLTCSDRGDGLQGDCYTPLMQAAGLDSAFVEFLLHANARPNLVVDLDYIDLDYIARMYGYEGREWWSLGHFAGESALSRAIRKGMTKNVKLLVAQVTANETTEVISPQLDGTNTKIGRFTPALLRAIGVPNEEEIFEFLLENGASVNAADLDGETPVLGALKAKKFQLLDLLLKRGADVKAMNSSGETAISVAVTLGMKKELIGIMLDRGASVNTRTPESIRVSETGVYTPGSEEGDTLLILAVKRVEEICRSKNASECDDAKKTVEYLLARGADKALKSDRRTAFSCASFKIWGMKAYDLKP